MNKKFCKTLGLAILIASSLPFSLVSAETVEEVPTGETTISSIADDPLKEYKERAANQVSSIEEPESEPKKETETQTTEDTPTTESSVEDTPDNEAKVKPQPRGGGIGPQTMNLIEGVDIDEDFAKFLRTEAAVQDLGTGWSGYGKAQDQLTDDDMAALTNIRVGSAGLTSLKGIEYAVNLTRLECHQNAITSLDLSSNTALTYLDCGYNQLISLDIINNTALTTLYCHRNQLTSLNVSACSDLENLACNNNSLTNLDISNNPNLLQLICSDNPLTTNLDISNSTSLVTLECSGINLTSLDVTLHTALISITCNNNQLGILDVSNNTKLISLNCGSNQIPVLDISVNVALTDLNCALNQLDDLDISTNIALTELNCGGNQLTSLDVSSNTALTVLRCAANNLTNLDVSANKNIHELSCNLNRITNLNLTNNTDLRYLFCSDNRLTSLDISSNTALWHLTCASNSLTGLVVGNNAALTYLDGRFNQISDITFALSLTNLSNLDLRNQDLTLEVPPIIGGQATIDLLKTTASAGLSLTNIDISGFPVLTPNGDKIELSNITALDLDEKSLSFEYDGTQLIEGASYGTKSFSGIITFQSISDLSNQLNPDKKKVGASEEVSWSWDIKSINPKKALNIHAELVLPSGLTLIPGSIEIDGVPANLNDIDGTNNLGDLDTGQSKIITFKTKAVGSAEEWLEPVGKLNWEDISPRNNQTKGAVQIKDDEQTYTPKDTDDMSIQSVPVYFNYGTNPIMSTAQTYNLDSVNYQTNTNVVTDGFYTRIKDERTISTGWKLTAKLSDFKDSSNTPMPNGTGTSLKLENMSIERVTDRDTPQETIDPSPTGVDVPSSVQSTETIVAGQPTAKTLVTAQPNQGQDTWQLRMPFDKISLNVPANAGKKGTVYKAKLTWSLDDTP